MHVGVDGNQPRCGDRERVQVEQVDGFPRGGVAQGERPEDAGQGEGYPSAGAGLGPGLGGLFGVAVGERGEPSALVLTLRLTPNPGQVVVWSGGLEGRLVGLSGQVVFVL